MHLLLFHKLIFLVLLVAAEKKQLPLSHDVTSMNKIAVSEMKSVSQDEGSSSFIGINNAVSEMMQTSPGQEQQHLREAPTHSSDKFFMNKRTVPNTSDPIHNR
ncbi:hypothetical protein POM88_011441 [Heracleum sosnowskyi]|uniref:Uncharacterized protein n=1 Tax=Heracleum sosnowskyi TaxID=360622 RepID=A0AAD8MWH7_9APIA|nr:hypothetical protein POM88_011441 [Heracleum sosnowskyi]